MGLHDKQSINFVFKYSNQVQFSSVQFKMVSMYSEKPTCTPPWFSEVSPTFKPFKRFNSLSDWWRRSPLLSFQERLYSASSSHANTKGITHHISSRHTPHRFLFSSGSEMLGLHYTREPKHSRHGAWGCDRSSVDHHLGGIPLGWNPSAGTCVLIGSYSSCRCMMHRLHHRCSLFLNKGRKR